MYFPYFRGKQYELVLLKEQANKTLKSGKIIPIIEPVKENLNPLQRAIEQFDINNVTYILIVNPENGDFKDQRNIKLLDFIKKLQNSNLIIGIVANATTILENVKQYLDSFKDYKIAILHKSFLDATGLSNLLQNYSIEYNIFISNEENKRYIRKFKNIGKKVIIKDGFKRQKNANYPPIEHFSDLHLEYSDGVMDGFGDFLIVGDDYSESGGPAWAVAIHMTYLDSNDDNDMYIKHYISDRRDDIQDTSGKFIEALKYLIEDEKKNHLYNTDASKEYEELYKKKLFRGLGYVKKLSMQNHLEIIARFLEEIDV
ncbi:sce7725 family protein [Hydrogenimonas thermophila]|uniref:sce7725 family protein n=1 Tax=Hydrogenimonas thermophila TaxID=223786 RepID=UPI002936EF2D|nr:sce7725 family protein [Hydrogenimonas thermophila]WOE70671.1 sce7725 family protein [Hydrogenimonas thermophila]WOE73189.1 sce7725 family protein [Hydrogenimonas thermophila]